MLRPEVQTLPFYVSFLTEKITLPYRPSPAIENGTPLIYLTYISDTCCNDNKLKTKEVFSANIWVTFTHFSLQYKH